MPSVLKDNQRPWPSFTPLPSRSTGGASSEFPLSDLGRFLQKECSCLQPSLWSQTGKSNSREKRLKEIQSTLRRAAESIQAWTKDFYGRRERRGGRGLSEAPGRWKEDTRAWAGPGPGQWGWLWLSWAEPWCSQVLRRRAGHGCITHGCPQPQRSQRWSVF